MKSLRWIGFVGVLTVLGLADAQEQPRRKDSPEVAKLREKLSEVAKKRIDLQKEQQKIYAEIREDKTLQELEAKTKEAEKAVREKMSTLDKDARAKMQEADQAYRKALDALIAKDEEISSLQKELDELQTKYAEMQYQRDLARFQLTHRNSPIQRLLDADEELAKVKKETVGVRGKGYRAYLEARNKAMEELEEAKPLLEKVAEAEKIIKDYPKTRSDLQGKLRKATSKIDNKDNDELKKVREARDEARKALYGLYSKPEVRDLDKARREAITAKAKKYQELVKDNVRLQAIKKEIADLTQEYTKINRDIFEARRKARDKGEKPPKEKPAPKDAPAKNDG